MQIDGSNRNAQNENTCNNVQNANQTEKERKI